MAQITNAETIEASRTARFDAAAHQETGFWRRAGIAGTVALALNIPIFLIANAAMTTPIQAEAADGTVANLPLATVPIATILAVLGGMALLALAKRFDRVRPALVIIGVVGALSAFGPAGVDVITNGASALVPMHFTTTAAVIGTHLWTTR